MSQSQAQTQVQDGQIFAALKQGDCYGNAFHVIHYVGAVTGCTGLVQCFSNSRQFLNKYGKERALELVKQYDASFDILADSVGCPE